MNDPFELSGSRWSDPQVDSILSDHASATIGALCFSTNWSNPLLGSHYAEKHNGICLGFDIDAQPGEVQTPIYVDGPEMQEPTVLFEAIRTGHFGIVEGPIMRKLLLLESGVKTVICARMAPRWRHRSVHQMAVNTTLGDGLPPERCRAM